MKPSARSIGAPSKRPAFSASRHSGLGADLVDGSGHTAPIGPNRRSRKPAPAASPISAQMARESGRSSWVSTGFQRMEDAMRRISLILAAVFAASVASAAEPDRYRLEKTAEGYVRMDTRTGEMSICEERWGELVCRMAADERTAFQDELERLQSDMDALEGRLPRSRRWRIASRSSRTRWPPASRRPCRPRRTSTGR